MKDQLDAVEQKDSGPTLQSGVGIFIVAAETGQAASLNDRKLSKKFNPLVIPAPHHVDYCGDSSSGDGCPDK